MCLCILKLCDMIRIELCMPHAYMSTFRIADLSAKDASYASDARCLMQQCTGRLRVTRRSLSVLVACVDVPLHAKGMHARVMPQHACCYTVAYGTCLNGTQEFSLLGMPACCSRPDVMYAGLLQAHMHAAVNEVDVTCRRVCLTLLIKVGMHSSKPCLAVAQNACTERVSAKSSYICSILCIIRSSIGYTGSAAYYSSNSARRLVAIVVAVVF